MNTQESTNTQEGDPIQKDPTPPTEVVHRTVESKEIIDIESIKLEFQTESVPDNRETPFVYATILGTEMRRNFLFYFTVYKIHVNWTSTNGAYYIYRSYSDFRDLDSRLRPLFKETKEDFPEFPISRWFGTMEADYIVLLMSQLREYLYKIIRIPTVVHTQIIQDFLKEDSLFK